MSISSPQELEGIKKVSDAVAVTLREMTLFAKPGISTYDLDMYGKSLLEGFGASSAPFKTYGFPGYTCISINNEVAHGIPDRKKILKEGDLINIDVSAELDGFWADNGGSFVLGEDIHGHKALVDASRRILHAAIAQIKGGLKINELGRFIQTEARKSGFKVIKNLVGHGVGRSLHEEPKEIPCFYDRYNTRRFKKKSVVAIETFISSGTSYAKNSGDGWTFITGDGSYVAQHEHTILITDKMPIILTESNNILN